MDIELLLHVAPFLYLPPRSHPFLEVLERLVTQNWNPSHWGPVASLIMAHVEVKPA